MVIWERAGKPAPAARVALSYERIAHAGVELADAEGLAAVSMRKVAERLGAGTMSLYRYVHSRDDLIHLMADQVCAEALAPPRSGSWRNDLAAVARVSRQVALRHPWLAGYSNAMASFGPNMLAMMESTLALLDGYGLPSDRMLDLWATVQAFVQGYALEESARQETQRRTGLSKQQWRQQLSPYLGRVMASGRYPLVARVVLNTDEQSDPEQVFERRLGYLLDGLAQEFFPPEP